MKALVPTGFSSTQIRGPHFVSLLRPSVVSRTLAGFSDAGYSSNPLLVTVVRVRDGTATCATTSMWL
jgi:hypothetical protein